MPRQGVRRKQRERAAAKKVLQKNAKPQSTANDISKRRGGASTKCQPADMEAALSSSSRPNEKLFELANRPSVCVNVGGMPLKVLQDLKTQEHSGGVAGTRAF
ncbi:unnamed protein product [Durusdinium trenchii]|uniref:Uncharacterized protein n=1 Tax=Durusdinium trenchii TaxID=1381693 RepID=A0ABP0SBC7_9DINO